MKKILFALLFSAAALAQTVVVGGPKAGAIVSVADYGAVGNDVSDDTAAIQRAINSYTVNKNGGATFVVPAGTYKITSKISFPARSGFNQGQFVVQCAGRQTTMFKWYGADQGVMFEMPAGGNPVRFEHCGFNSIDTSHRAIFINTLGGTEYSMVDNYFSLGWNAWQATSTFINRVEFNRFYGLQGDCLNFVSGASAVIETTITNNEFGICGQSGAGYAINQQSQGGGGANWLRIEHNDFEGTIWNGAMYLKNVYSPYVVGNREEHDSGIADGSWRFAVLDGTQNGFFAKNEMSSGVTLKNNASGNLFVQNNHFNSIGGTTAIDLGTGGGSCWLIGTVPGTWTPCSLLGNSIEGFVDGDIKLRKYIIGGNQNEQKTANLYLGNSTGGYNTIAAGYPNSPGTAPILPSVQTGASFQSGAIVLNSLFGDASGAPHNRFIGWVCRAPASTCTWNGTTWTSGAWDYLSSSACMTIDATAAPVGGTWSTCDQIRNTAPSEQGTAGSKYVITGWMCTSGGTPGTWLPMRSLTGN